MVLIFQIFVPTFTFIFTSGFKLLFMWKSGELGFSKDKSFIYCVWNIRLFLLSTFSPSLFMYVASIISLS